MNPGPISTEIVDEDKQLAVVIQQNSLLPETAQSLQSSFAPLFGQAKTLISQSRAVVVTDASQIDQIKLSRAFRLQLRRVRIEGENLRKSLKEESVKRGRAIDAFNTILLHLVESEEARLDNQEKIVERQEAARKETLKQDRIKALQPYGLDTSFLSLGEMPDELFAQLLENTRAGHEAKLAALKKAEEDRILAENNRLKEEARIREENARLKREADEREAALKAERETQEKERLRLEAIAEEERKKAAEAARQADEERKRIEAEAAKALAEQQRVAKEAADAAAKKAKEAQEAAAQKAKAEKDAADAIARKEREAREKAEAEVKRAKDAEKKRIADELAAKKQAEADELAAKKKAALAPDKEKLLAFSKSVSALVIPDLSSEEAKQVADLLKTKVASLCSWIERESSVL